MDLLAQKYSQDFKTQLDLLRVLKTFIEMQTDTTALTCMDTRAVADTQEWRHVHTGGTDTSTHRLLAPHVHPPRGHGAGLVLRERRQRQKGVAAVC